MLLDVARCCGMLLCVAKCCITVLLTVAICCDLLLVVALVSRGYPQSDAEKYDNFQEYRQFEARHADLGGKTA